MERRAKVELFEQIRREYEFGIGTIQGVANKYQVHRRMVRQALANAMPPDRKRSHRCCPCIDSVRGIIDQILEGDKQAPRKQRHTAHRIYQRIKETYPEHQVGERSVRAYVSRRKWELGIKAEPTFIPQSYDWGQEAQVDWYEASAEIGGELQKAQVFSMRSMASGGAFHRAYPRATQQALLEAHELGFRYFGGVFRQLRYDNLSSAVRKILRGHEREQTARLIAFRSHWKYEALFCNPAEAHEKGGVEGEVGYFRRNHWVPVPKASNWEELNQHLLKACQQDQHRRIGERSQSVGEGMQQEQGNLLPLAEEGFQLAEVSFPRVTHQRLVPVRTNWYSVPARVGSQVEARVRAAVVEFWQEGQCLACHPRCYSRRQQILDLEHYLDVLEHKPGALAGSKPLEQWRQQGRWPACYDRYWQELIRRQGQAAGTRAMIEIVELGKKHGYAALTEALDRAIQFECWDQAAVRLLLGGQKWEHVPFESLEVGEALARYERPLPVVTAYDQLLEGEVAR